MNTNGPNLIHQRDGMVLWITILFLQGAGLVGSMTGIPGAPENITVMFLNPTSVRVSWSTSQVEQIEKYDVTYKPTDARVVVVVAGNSEAVTLSGLRADTQYQLAVTAVRAGKKLRSRPIVFRTLEPPRSSPQHDALVTGSPPVPPPPPSIQQTQNYIQIRGVEVGIVVVVLMVWAGAIALFFNRWGKIRMLLPYQPDYKEQLKVPGTGVCATANSSCPQHTTQHACSQHVQWSNYHVDSMDSGGGGLGWPRASRPRINSATDVAGFLSQEFLRRHGSTSRLCRKVRSADNLPLETGNRHNHDNDHHHNHNEDSSDRHHHYSRDESIETDRETFLLTSQERTERYSDENVSKMQISLEGTTKDAVETSLIEPCYQQLQQQQPQSLLRDSLAATSSVASSLVSRRFGGWRVGGSHEYVRCPVRQPVSIDERAYRRSCEPDFARITHHHHHHHHQSSVTAPNPPGTHLNHHAHRLENNERSSKSFDYAKKNVETPSVDNNQHFGLPILSISEPSPPDERERLDEYL